ncbi:HIT family protein [Pseudothauera nasutitermitis]|uniref:HIT family protein n=1 Tax=Pseudothauera nasutitermitis TaxID=2565930 RepID=A0A4S4AZH9_9RHOO|nr:HIT family protein [Pseudothauera nasutitermitis]THF64771.1 HIT family protein [Pseudothauera nasutitermitis]
MSCPLCRRTDELLLWEDAHCRVIRVEDEHYPGFCRVIWNTHVAEMSDLPSVQRQHLLDVVVATEQALRATLHPDKINLASLGNMVPHLHWHVIPRHAGDRHFPDPVWAAPRRDGIPLAAPGDEALSAALRDALRATRT